MRITGKTFGNALILLLLLLLLPRSYTFSVSSVRLTRKCTECLNDNQKKEKWNRKENCQAIFHFICCTRTDVMITVEYLLSAIYQISFICSSLIVNKCTHAHVRTMEFVSSVVNMKLNWYYLWLCLNGVFLPCVCIRNINNENIFLT